MFTSVCVPSILVLAIAEGSKSNPPNMTLNRFLFMALHIIYERIAPEDPTSAPTMVNNGLLSMNPSAHNAQPEYEFKTVMTTGISAPPIAFVRVTPKVLLAAVARTRDVSPTPKLSVFANKPNEMAVAAASAILT